ncbi:MAG: MOSC domain-containing protein [Planctomycetota bacterium]|nr:MOSC domain-containing protein [Planctomycetota bacterium]
MPELASINISAGGIPKCPHPTAVVSIGGLDGDGHDHEKHRVPEQAISLLDLELLEAIATEHELDLVPGSLGENLTVSGVGVQRLGEGDRLAIHPDRDDPVVLEITRVRPPCYVLDVLSTDFKRTLWNRIGMDARVVRPGPIEAGATIELDLACEGPRPIVRTPKEGCIDGADVARRILASHGLEPLPSATNTTESIR